MGFLRAARLDAWPGRWLGRLPLGAIAAAALAIVLFVPSAGRAVEAINVHSDTQAIDLTDAVDFQHTEGDRIQVSTAPGADGIIRRIEVRARAGGNN